MRRNMPDMRSSIAAGCSSHAAHLRRDKLQLVAETVGGACPERRVASGEGGGEVVGGEEVSV